jgi:hypothetical protein
MDGVHYACAVFVAAAVHVCIGACIIKAEAFFLIMRQKLT